MNGVVIEVAIEKMSSPDIQFLEDITGRRLAPGDDEIPLDRAVEQRRRAAAAANASAGSPSASGGRARESERERERRKEKEREREREARHRQESAGGASRSKRNVDWFEFFLAAGVDMDDCTRYATIFERDKIDETILPELSADTLRKMGLREGDIIRVVRLIERKYKPRDAPTSNTRERQIKSDEELARKLQEEEQSARRGKSASPAPQLFSGPDGSLKNNTRRGRPTPAAAATSSSSTSVDAASLVAASESLRLSNNTTPAPRTSTSGTASPESSRKPLATPVPSGFDDDAWTPRPPSVKPATPAIAATPSPAPAPPAAPTPPPAPSPAPAPAPAEPAKPPADPNSALFDKLAAMKPSTPASPYGRPGASPMGDPMLGGGAYNGPRGPLAPVPGNQGLLSPLVPTGGTGQFVPTRTGLQGQPTGWGGMQAQQTGWGGMQAQQTGWGGMQQPQQTGYGMGMGMGMQMQPTGYGGMGQQQQQYGMQMQQTGWGQQQQQQPQSTFGMLSAQAQKQEKEKDTTPSSIFAQMKSGAFAKDDDNDARAPQSSDKYDALRGFSQGGVVYPQQTGFPMQMQPQQTGMFYPQQTGYQQNGNGYSYGYQ